jgi:hypothetical protein
MALVPNFVASQLYSNIKTITITDTSTGSDGAITTRKIYLLKPDGNSINPVFQFAAWNVGTSTIDITNILDRDYAVAVKVDWLNGASIVYTKTILCLFKAYSELYLYQLTQFQSANNRLTNSDRFFNNKSKLRCLIDDAIQAVELANDHAGAQLCLNEAKKFTDNPTYFF